MDDSSDTTITFDSNGYCNYCSKALDQFSNIYFPNEEGENRQKKLLEKVRSSRNNNSYDCIMGLSGGLDSSYLAYLGYKWGLRVLAVHIDDGYYNEISQNNLRKLVKAIGFDYLTIVPDEKQFNALTKAYMKAGVPNIAIPQDNVLFAFIYDCARKYRIKYFLSGSNFSLECILQRGNIYKAYDKVNLFDINKRFGTERVDKLRFISTINTEIINRYYGIQTISPLNYIEYNRDKAFIELKEFCGFEYYGRKHLENRLTEFIQLYWFPKKFGVDKRTSHLSSMIVSGQITREEALAELSKPLFDDAKMLETVCFIKKKLDLSDAEFDLIMSAPTHQHTDYRIEEDTMLYKALRILKKITDKRKISV